MRPRTPRYLRHPSPRVRLASVRDLPAGTVTFLFTDVEGSTRLLHEHGAAYAELLAQHRRILREASTRNGGVEVDTQGDAFFFAFARASEALAAAREGQEALREGPIRVRMGVHTGEPIVTDEGYVGLDVHRAARIAAVGHGGQVVVSRSTHDLAGDHDLRDLGEHRLKDLSAPERIFQLGDGEFPPLRSLNATNLPVAANPLVGRERELAELLELFRDSARLVTLTGAGGSGKTRLGLQAAAELVGDFPRGVFFVPLAGVRQPELVASTIAATVGVRDLSELRERRALLVVDNFEHLLDAAPEIAALLAAAPLASVLATSRAPLRLEGEREYPLEPLRDEDAVELLTQRARAVRPDFEPDDSAREICRRLDGLPLAVELAASRLRSLGSRALLERLERRLPLLTGGRRDAPERQRTLRETIEWSYDLLPADQQQLFRRLSVFAGGFSLAGAEVVCDADLDLVDALVEASLLKAAGQDRFLMLETIREFAAERLDANEEAEAIRRRHAEFFVELAQSANLTIEAEGPMQHGLVVPERSNVRGALAWAIASGYGDLGLRLATALENFWVTTDPDEGRRWLEDLLPLGPAAPSPLHALALRCIGNCAAISGDEAAEDLYEQSLAESSALGDELRSALVSVRIAIQAFRRGDEARARRLLEVSLAFFRRIGFRKGEAQCLDFLGHLERRGGSPERALELYEGSTSLYRETGFSWGETRSLLASAETLFELGRPAEAARSATEALGVARRIDDRIGTVYALAVVARAVAEQGDAEPAGRLWGALEAEVDRAPVAGWKRDLDELAAPVLAHTGPAFETARAEGRLWPFEQAVALALEGVS